MRWPPTPRTSLASCLLVTVGLLLAGTSGCAGPAAGPPNAETHGGEAAREEAPRQCHARTATLERDVDASGAEVTAEAESTREDAPSMPSSTAAPSPEPQRAHDPLDVASLYAAQDANVDTLGAALEAADCAAAARLGGEICRLAERVCSLDECGPRCEEARGRCTRALERIHARCGTP